MTIYACVGYCLNRCHIVSANLAILTRHGSFYLWMHRWVAGKTVRSLVNTCHNWTP